MTEMGAPGVVRHTVATTTLYPINIGYKSDNLSIRLNIGNKIR
jgi:hypothetical protein